MISDQWPGARVQLESVAQGKGTPKQSKTQAHSLNVLPREIGAIATPSLPNIERSQAILLQTLDLHLQTSRTMRAVD